MVKWHLKSKRKATGGKRNRSRKKKRRDRGLEFLETRIGERKVKPVRKRGGRVAVKLLLEQTVNLAEKGKVHKAKILSVERNPANKHFVRRNVITKGAIIKTDKGLAVVTSRPNKSGIVNAVKAEK